MASSIEISVIVTAHSRREFLKQALISLSTQTLSRELFEVIVVKNFEDDGIDNLISSLGYITIPVPVDSTIGFDLYLGIDKAKGQIICFLDDDDIFVNGKLSRIKEIFERIEVGCVKNNIFFMDKAGQKLQKGMRLQINRSQFIGPGKLKGKAAYFNRIRADFNLSSMSVRKLILLPYLEEIRENLEASTDTFVFCAALSGGLGIYFERDHLTGYRFHDSTSRFIENDENSMKRAFNQWDKQIENYNRFFNTFYPFAASFLNTRILSQKLTTSIRRLDSEMVNAGLPEQPLQYLLSSLRKRDILLAYDSIRYFLMTRKVAHLVNKN